MVSSYFYVPRIRRRMRETQFPAPNRLAGHTVAKDFVLIHKLMQAIKSSGIDTQVVNLSFPDHTNYILSNIGLAPTIGGGTIDLTIQGVRSILSQRLKIPIHNIEVTMICNHPMRGAPPENVPHYIRIRVAGEDVTDKYDTNEILRESVKATAHRFNAGITAASGVKNLLAIINDTGEIRHAPGVPNMPGGVPVRLDAKGATILLPKGITMSEALRMNREGWKPDGIEEIKDDGTVVFTELACRLLKELLGLDWTQVKVTEMEQMTDDLIQAYTKLPK